jgi:hypothetical protein
MKIEKYSFGKMVVDGTSYSSDVIIYPDHVDENWWRLEGHLLQMPDLEAIIETNPDIIVVGTGYMGVMKVPEEIGKELLKKNIHLFVARTGKAVEIYNERPKGKKVIGAFHLTC